MTLVTGAGVEPAFAERKSAVLPLDESAKNVDVYRPKSFKRFIKIDYIYIITHSHEKSSVFCIFIAF